MKTIAFWSSILSQQLKNCKSKPKTMYKHCFRTLFLVALSGALQAKGEFSVPIGTNSGTDPGTDSGTNSGTDSFYTQNRW